MHTLAAIENIFFLILVAIVGLVRWIAQVAENKRNTDAAKRANPPANVPPPRAPATTEEERVRRFMEALGVPGPAAPPPKTPPRPVVAAQKPRIEKRKVRPIDPFPKPSFAPWIPQPPTSTEPPPRIETPPPAVAPIIFKAPAPLSPLTTSLEEFGVQMIDRPTGIPQGVSSKKSWASRLATADGLRDAIVLREIFGPPRSMEPL